MADNNIGNIIDVTIDKVRTLVDSETIIGEKITVDDVTIIPVSKVSFGLATGGSDFPSKSTANKLFGGGGGAGATVTPVAFLVIKGNEVKLLNIGEAQSSLESAIKAVPDIINTVSNLFKKDKSDDNN